MKQMIALALLAAAPAAAETLSVKVTNAIGNAPVIVGVFQQSDGFGRLKLDKAMVTRTATVTGGSATLRFEGLAAGRYALAAFQDLDGDGQLKTNFIGIPREPVGVSNNPGGLPSFTKSLVAVPAPGMIEINLRRLGG